MVISFLWVYWFFFFPARVHIILSHVWDLEWISACPHYTRSRSHTWNAHKKAGEEGAGEVYQLYRLNWSWKLHLLHSISRSCSLISSPDTCSAFCLRRLSDPSFSSFSLFKITPLSLFSWPSYNPVQLASLNPPIFQQCSFMYVFMDKLNNSDTTLTNDFV